MLMEHYILINDLEIPLIRGIGKRKMYGGVFRDVEEYTMTINYQTAKDNFTGVPYSLKEVNGEEVTVYDKSAYEVPCAITDNLDGTMSVAMGKLTNEEILLIDLLGGN